jgi:uncharacterized membrane protein
MRSLRGLVGGLLMLVGVTGEVRADFDLCNRTAWWLDANLTYGVQGRYTSVGGPRLLLPGECKTLIEGPVDPVLAYYVTAFTASGAYEQAPDWHLPTDHGLCNVDGRGIFFEIDRPQPCDDDELTLASWRRVLPDPADFTFAFTSAFTSASDWTLEQARRGGAQQFLNLLGYDVGPVDAVVGRRTTRGLRRYQADQGRTADGEVTPEIVAALASSLRQRYLARQPRLLDPPGNDAGRDLS